MSEWLWFGLAALLATGAPVVCMLWLLGGEDWRI